MTLSTNDYHGRFSDYYTEGGFDACGSCNFPPVTSKGNIRNGWHYHSTYMGSIKGKKVLKIRVVSDCCGYICHRVIPEAKIAKLERDARKHD